MRQPVLTITNREHLAALAIHLSTVHRHHFTHKIIFGMSEEEDGAAFTSAQKMKVTEEESPFMARFLFCDAPSCMTGNPFGHFVLIGPDPGISESWEEYIEKHLGLSKSDPGTRDYATWITDGEWDANACMMLGMSKSDGRPIGASQRIETLLTTGIPDNWHQVGDLMMDV